jgi:dihydrofolate synthase/folylpolyglutamate synthase
MKRNLQLFPDTPSADRPHLSFILDLPPSVMTLGLGTITRLLAALGNPHKQFKSIVVAGSNGKGSVTVLLSSILMESGYRVGRLISPHVYAVNERVSVNERPLSLDALEEAAALVAPLHNDLHFSFFEGITAIAFLAFAEAGVDFAVLEVGLGGRFDATNVVNPALSIITSITLDHRNLLGDSEEEIIREKLGITRRGVPLLLGPLRENLKEIAADKAKRDRFPALDARDNGECSVERLGFDSMTVSLKTKRNDYGDIAVALPGSQQTDNVLLAAVAAEQLLETVPKMKRGLERAFLPGRFEHRAVRDRNIILDVAHNDAALIGVLKTLLELSPPENNRIVLGMMRRKELFKFPAHLVSAASRIYLLRPPDGDACTPQELLARIGYDAIQSAGTEVELIIQDCSGEACARLFRRIIAATPRSGSILVTGSHRMVELFGTVLSRGEMT